MRRALTRAEKQHLASLPVGSGAAILFPTKLGLSKDYSDATIPIRKILRESGLHDYEQQEKGPAHKVLKQCVLKSPAGEQVTEIALFRPNSGNGDPRLRISKLKSFADAGDALALYAKGDRLHVVNLTRNPVRTASPVPQAVEAAPGKEDHVFPRGLLRWAGHRSGGVKKIFLPGSGRPLGFQIETNLTRKLDQFAGQLADNEDCDVEALLLVGGPGNGKTDALEYFVERLDNRLACGGRLRKHFAGLIRPDGFYPRKATCPVDKLAGSKFHRRFKTVSIVQDASVNDIDNPSESEAELLLRDLEGRLDPKGGEIYIACINRGIIAEAYSISLQRAPEGPLTKFLSSLFRGLSPAADPAPLWPLAGYAQVAVWPMDVESLVSTGEQASPARQILKEALKESRWSACGSCPAKETCPFHRNATLLRQDSQALDSVLKLLSYYELYTAGRLNFRDLFSLVTQILVGHDTDFPGGDPCTWAWQKHKDLSTGNSKMEALLSLLSKRYEHVIFPRWPHLQAKSEQLKSILSADVSDFSAGSWLKCLAKPVVVPRTSAERLLRHSLGMALDPVEAVSATAIGDTGLTVGQVEESFSHDLRQGLRYCDGQLDKMERDLIESLTESTEEITRKKTSQQSLPSVDELTRLVKMYCSRFALRGVCTRTGSFRDGEYYESYLHTIRSVRAMKEKALELRKLYLSDNEKLTVSLLGTFGQPPPEIHADVTLYADKVSFRGEPAKEQRTADGVPLPSAPFLWAGGVPIMLTYRLYRALCLLGSGLKPASLPTELGALLGYIKARIGGKATHGDTESMYCIKIGRMGRQIKFGLEGEFHIE